MKNYHASLERSREARELIYTEPQLRGLKAKADKLMEIMIRRNYERAVADNNVDQIAKQKQLAELQGITL